MVKNLLIIQARSGSKRLKNKVFLKLHKDISILDLILKRVSNSKLVDKIILAVPRKDKKKFDKVNLKNPINIFYGSEKNVLKRYFEAAKKINPLNIVRITSDCPFIDSRLIDKVLKIHSTLKNHYTSTDNRSFPDGQDIEVFTYRSFKKVYSLCKKSDQKEHVTRFYYETNFFKTYILKSKKNYSNIRITIDYPSDLIYLRMLYKKLLYKDNFSLNDILKVVKAQKQK